jgi:hypothetical protein
MVDVSALGAALSSLKAAKDIAEAMVGLRDGAAFQQKQIEFQSKLIDANNAAFAAQDERAAMLQRISQLEKQIADFEAWEAESQRYRLTQLAPGTVTYLLKEEADRAEPAHCICSNCYEDRKKSILHIFKSSLGEAHISCPRCKIQMKCWGEGDDFPLAI